MAALPDPLSNVAVGLGFLGVWSFPCDLGKPDAFKPRDRHVPPARRAPLMPAKQARPVVAGGRTDGRSWPTVAEARAAAWGREANLRSTLRDPKLEAMSSSVFSATHSVLLSNQRFAALFDFAVTVGNSKAASAEEFEFVARLVSSTSDMYLGFDLSIEDCFPAVTQQDFWRRVFLEVAAQIRNGSIGNTVPPTKWRSKAADDAEAIARILATRPP